jgi:phosphoribosylanthranilate isomerase
MANDSLRRTRVKMCGTTRLEDALFAVKQGIDALGFIFFEKSPRNIDRDRAGQIIAELPPFVDRVGVFVNAPIEKVLTGAKTGLSALQLHGTESVEYCQEVKKQVPHCALIKAFRVGDDSRAKEFATYNDVVDAFLLDTYVKGAEGGTGEVFDWSIIDTLGLQRPFLLAGGLTPDNVKEALHSVRPYGIDINSGVESSPGIKDHSKLASLLDLVRHE